MYAQKNNMYLADKPDFDGKFEKRGLVLKYATAFLHPVNYYYLLFISVHCKSIYLL